MREKQLLNKKGLTHESIPTADMVKMKKKNIMPYAACEGPNNLTPLLHVGEETPCSLVCATGLKPLTPLPLLRG